jgi:DNA-binding NarL/FixJ family response regulator
VLSLLRAPRSRVVYVTSQPILPRIIDYFFGLVPELDTRDARERFHVVSLVDAANRPLTDKLLERPGAVERIRRLILGPELALLLPFTTSEREVELAVQLGLPVFGRSARRSTWGALEREGGIVEERIRVLVVDDDALVRAAIAMMLAGADDIAIVAEVTDGNEVAREVAEHRPAIVLMDIRMPGMDGRAATELLRAQDNAPDVIVLPTFDADDYVLRALRAGASGFLMKHTPPADIVRAVRAVAAGEPMLSPTITRRLIGHVTDSEGRDRTRHARERLDRLTEREREVAVAIGLGKTNAEISRELYMSVATVKAHVSHVLEKLECNNRVQIALLAHDVGEA